MVILTNLLAELEQHLVQVDLDSTQVMVMVGEPSKVLTLVVVKLNTLQLKIKNAVHFLFLSLTFSIQHVFSSDDNNTLVILLHKIPAALRFCISIGDHTDLKLSRNIAKLSPSSS